MVQKNNTSCGLCGTTTPHYKYAKKKEQLIADVLLTTGYQFQREVRIDFSCFVTDKVCAKLDFVLELPYNQM
jgi:hypothetical protein